MYSMITACVLCVYIYIYIHITHYIYTCIIILTVSIRTTSNRGPQIAEPLLIFTSKRPLKVRILPSAGPIFSDGFFLCSFYGLFVVFRLFHILVFLMFFQIELLRAGGARDSGRLTWTTARGSSCSATTWRLTSADTRMIIIIIILVMTIHVISIYLYLSFSLSLYIYIHIYIYTIYIYIYTHASIHIYIYIYIYTTYVLSNQLMETGWSP